MLSVVKMLQKRGGGGVGGCSFNSHGNYIVDLGNLWKNHGNFEFLWEP